MRFFFTFAVLSVALLSYTSAAPLSASAAKDAVGLSSQALEAASKTGTSSTIGSKLKSAASAIEKVVYKNTGQTGANKAVSKYGYDYDTKLTGKVVGQATSDKMKMVSAQMNAATDAANAGKATVAKAAKGGIAAVQAPATQPKTYVSAANKALQKADAIRDKPVTAVKNVFANAAAAA